MPLDPNFRPGQLTPCQNCNGPCSYDEVQKDVTCDNHDCKYFDTRRVATLFAKKEDSVESWNNRFIDRWPDGWKNGGAPLEQKIE